MRATASILVVATAIAAAAPVRADDELAEAERLEAGLQYDQALAIVDRLIARGGAGPRRLVVLHLLAGRLAAGLDRTTLAEDHFARALALQPGAKLPEGTSPKITAPFSAARARVVPLRVTASLTGRVVALAVGPDPAGLVAGIQVDAVDPGGHHVDVTDGHALRVELPPGVAVAEVRALDATGNRVWLGTVAPAAPALAMAPLHEVPPVPAAPRYRRWSSWAVLGGAALAAGGLCAWRSDVAQHAWDQLRAEDGQHDYSELRAVELRGRRWAIAADVGFGVAAGAAVATAIAYFTRPRSPAPVTITAGPGTLGVAITF